MDRRRCLLSLWLCGIAFFACLLTKSPGDREPEPGAVVTESDATESDATESDATESEATGSGVEALLERARFLSMLGEVDLAIQVLETASRHDSESVAVKHALARAYYAEGQLEPAFATLEEALRLAKEGEAKAALLMMRASIYLLWKAPAKAAEDCEAAFAAFPEHGRIEWYLRRAYAQRMADHYVECEKGLREGVAATASAVLHAQWVDALIDAKDYEAAQGELEKLSPGLRDVASWQIRQARIFQGLDRDDAAQEALKAAREELDERLDPEAENPDIILLVDRALAHFLLGDREAARGDYERAKAAGAMGWMHWRLSKIFEPGTP